ncbi:uncharacterized protein LOC117101487 [Anneissia japonica]|uniref:uncharacterized protein LOC117101487 n=1 Tax=Anneissia japonica TaxID=1529436 RepID=UPI001425847A|nr:uncharacterized protein LOC117101487 [Anneissia japonica]
MGDRPSATIATVALRKTAERGKDKLYKAADTILRNVYVDNILESVESREAALRLSQDIDKLIAPRNFAVKKWLKAPVVLTKSYCLSSINGIYDPLGLISPFTVKGKILLRKIWGEKLGWDDTLPDAMREQWFQFFNELTDIASICFPRCIKPEDAEPNTRPTLVVFSDGSEQAFGAVAYARYLLKDSRYACRLIASKNRVAPLQIISIVRLELSGAVLNKRLTCYIKKEMRLSFEREYHIIDSEIVRAMIQKQSYGFQTFAFTRIGEIQSATNPQDWWWCKGELNVGDLITRGERPSELSVDST